jgi:ubiquinone biosynthesis protein
MEALGGRISRNLERLTGAIAAAAIVFCGSMLVIAPPETSWHHYFGEAMIVIGVFATLLVGITVVRGDQGRGRGRR